jgi:hypothetical protein
MGYQDKIIADLDKQIGQYSSKALTAINSKLPPLNADGIRSILPLNKIPAIPGVPSIPSIKVCLPDIDALVDQIKHDIPAVPSIPNISKVLPTVTLPELPAVPSLPTKEDIWKMLSVDVRNTINLAETDIATLQSKLVSSLPALPALPSLPSLPSILNTLCAPPPEAPEAKTLMPTVVKQAVAAIPATLTTAAVPAKPAVIKTPMDDKNINKKAQLAIIGEIDRQRMIKEIIVILTALMPVCDDINTKMHDYSQKLYQMTDKANLGTDEGTWKTTLTNLRQSVSDTFLASKPIGDAIDSIYHDYCIDPNSVDPALKLYAQKVSPLMAPTASIINKLSNFEVNLSLDFFDRLAYPLISTVDNSIEKFGYAQWKGYGTEWDWSLIAKTHWTILQSNSTFINSLTKETITDTFEIMYARKYHEVISVTIARLQATLPDK